MVLFSRFQNRVNIMMLFYHPMDEFQTTNEFQTKWYTYADHWVVSRRIEDFLFFYLRGFENKRALKSFWRCCCYLILWFIYLERNRRTFDDRLIQLGILCEKAKFLVSLWAKANGLFEHGALIDLCRSN